MDTAWLVVKMDRNSLWKMGLWHLACICKHRVAPCFLIEGWAGFLLDFLMLLRLESVDDVLNNATCHVGVRDENLFFVGVALIYDAGLLLAAFSPTKFENICSDFVIEGPNKIGVTFS